jgi:hypothetical protein
MTAVASKTDASVIPSGANFWWPDRATAFDGSVTVIGLWSGPRRFVAPGNAPGASRVRSGLGFGP